jgi:integrase/recombinase XerD
MEYLSSLAKRELTGIARARKMSAIREYFRFLEGVGVITKSPTTGIETPKQEKNGRQVLRLDEYTKMLSLAGANTRDYAILQVFLQTGIRVSELEAVRKLMYNKSIAYKSLKVWQEIDCPVSLFLALPGI